MADTWLITGIPGAGTTTVARLLAERLERAVVIEDDPPPPLALRVIISQGDLHETADLTLASRDRARLE